MLAIRLISRVRSRLHINVPLRALFEAQTLVRFAQAFSRYETAPGQTEAIARLYLQVQAMSVEELEKLLREKKERGLADHGSQGCSF